MAHDVFISYSEYDKVVADATCATLESEGIRCWIAPRDVRGKWGPAVTQAIKSSRCMVLVLSARSNVSGNVEDEVAIAAANRVAIIPLRIEAVEPSENIELWLKKHHWLDAMTEPLEKHLRTLSEAVALLLKLPQEPRNNAADPASNIQSPPEETATEIFEAVPPNDPIRVTEPQSASQPKQPIEPPLFRTEPAQKDDIGSPKRRPVVAILVACAAAVVLLIGGFLTYKSSAKDGSPDHSANNITGNKVPSATRFSGRGNVELISIPAGEFWMGDSSRPDNRRHRVRLSAYSIGKTPVTVAQFMSYCTDQSIEFSKFKTPKWGWIPDHPMVGITWEDARKFCKWAGGDLPTEAQWEYAARGKDERAYPWSNRWDGTLLQWSSDGVTGSAGRTAPVDSHLGGASPFGCLDMAGNVWQWCLDRYAPLTSDKDQLDPVDMRTDGRRTIRGGSWGSRRAEQFTTSYRGTGDPDENNIYFGFRLAGPP